MSNSEFTAKALAEVSVEQLTKKFAFLKKELFNLRFQKTLGELTDVSKFAAVRKNVARVKTELTKRRKANA